MTERTLMAARRKSLTDLNYGHYMATRSPGHVLCTVGGVP
jgi:hypothetical protein